MECTIPVPIKIENKTVKLEIIDLDNYVSVEDLARKWHFKVRNKIKTLFGDQNEESLNIVMKWYLEVLIADLPELEISNLVIQNMNRHILFFHHYFKELQWSSKEEYLSNMEDILGFYINLECDLFVKIPKKFKHVRKKIWKVLKIYLLDQDERIYNVMLKLKINTSSESSKMFLDNLFRTVLDRPPTDTSEVAFCRAFILHQKWKKVQNPDNYTIIDELLLKNYSQTREAISSNSVIQKIMQTQNYTVLDVMAHMMNNDTVVSECYFEYIKSMQSEEELDLLNIDGIDLDEGSSHTAYDFEIENEFELDVGDTSNCERVIDTVKTETSDDECIVVGEGTLECGPGETEIVHEILDDDDDIASIIYFTSKRIEANVSSSRSKKSQADDDVSFLNSINVDSNVEINSTEDLPTPDSISSSNKLDDLRIDSVESREIISEKCTADTNSASCTIIDLQNDDWDGTKPSSDTEEPSQRFEGLVTPPTSHDDQHSYERDFQSTDLPEVDEEPIKETDENCFENNENVKETASFDCLTSHSKISNSSDRCNTSTSLSEVVSDETYVLPTSPDISSTCDPNDFVCEEEQEITIDEIPMCEMPSIDEIVSIEKDMITEISDIEKELPNKITNADKTTINEKNITNEIAQNTQVPKKNGNLLEHNNNNDEKDRIVSPHIELEKRVSLNDKSPRKGMEIIFTFKQKLKNPDEVHQKYDELKGKHGLDDCLTGPIEKIKFPTNLNLFGDSSREKEIINATSNSSSLLSPGFDSTDDFKSYVAYYQENRNKVNMTPKITYIQEKVNTPSIPEESRIRLKNSNNKSVSIPTEEHQRKRTRIAFEEKEIIGEMIPHEPIFTKPCFQLHSILKKSNSQPSRWKIQPEQMNPASLEQYSVKQNDPCLQGDPCVVIERMSEMEILKWYKFSENARRMRLQPKNNPMTMLRVDYDKSTTLLTENDKVMYRVNEPKNMQQNDHLKVNEGYSALNGQKNGKRKSLSNPVSDSPHKVIQRGYLALNGQNNRKRKLQSNSVSGSPHEVRKRGRPRKKT